MPHRTGTPAAAGEPLSALVVPPEVVGALALPEPTKLTDDQVRGARCVWCRAGLTSDTAIDFGEQVSPAPWSTSTIGTCWYPRACPACVAGHAHRGLLDHAPGCEDCRKRPTPGHPAACETARVLYRLVRGARR